MHEAEIQYGIQYGVQDGIHDDSRFTIYAITSLVLE